MLTIAIAVLFICASFSLSTELAYPESLIDKPSSAAALTAHATGLSLAGFLGLLVCGALLVVVSLKLGYHQKKAPSYRILLSGGSAGAFWLIAGTYGSISLFWNGTDGTAGLHAAAGLILLIVGMAVLPLLALWTCTLTRTFEMLKGLGVVGIIGLLIVLLRSLAWMINYLVPIETGFYATAGVLNILAVLGESLWLLWLLLWGFRTLGRAGGPDVPASTDNGRIGGRRRLLRAAVGLGLGLAGTGFLLARTGLTIAYQPVLESDDVPSEPSLLGTLFYLIAWIYLRILNPVHTVAQQKALPSSAMPLAPGVALEKVDAGGIPAERIAAPGAIGSKWIFYTHGGGWAQGITDGHRSFVARLSRETGATGLLPDYRLTPQHPFPAGLDDCVRAYRWLISQGIEGSHIVIAGESAGGNLALATALSLRDGKDALPAALAAMSPATDMAMTGVTFHSKAFVDPILGAGLAQDAFALYTNHGATDSRNPLVSPLYADVHGMPPTLLQVGTQEVLLSDSIRMADKLTAGGVETKLEIWPGMFHAFTSFDLMPDARLATQHVVKFIREHLGT